MTAKSKRTHPLDRDGDGKPGGSLPGNQTAPMADAAQVPAASEPPFAIAARRWTGEVSDNEIKAELNKRATLAWGEQGYVVEERLGDILVARAKPTDQPIITGPLRFAKGQDDIDPAHLMEAASEVAIDYWGTAHYTVDMQGEEAVARLHEGEKPWDDPAGDTFDAEQVAAATTAGEGAVIAEEGETVADPATATAPLDDNLVNIPTETAPVAVRLHELRILVTARLLYKSRDGYSSNYGPPYIDQATVDAWIAAGLAEDVPTAGNMGGVRVTSEGRSALNRAPADEAA